MPEASETCTPNSAITGNGVVISAMITSVLIVILTAAEVFCDPDIQIAPEVFPKARGITGWVRKAFRDTIVGLGVTQLVTSSSTILCALIYYPRDDPHAAFALALATLASCNQTIAMQVLIATETLYKAATLPRAILDLVQTFALFVIFVKHLEGSISQGLNTGLAIISSVPLTTNAAVSLSTLMRSEVLGSSKNLVLMPIVASWAAAIAALGLVLYLKYGNYWPFCPLHTPEENQITFGQLVAILMLVAVFVGLVESLIRYHSSEDDKDDREPDDRSVLPEGGTGSAEAADQERIRVL